jgi:acyl-CoA synthetase (AMP-forming)/AMP-acid ligase II
MPNLPKTRLSIDDALAILFNPNPNHAKLTSMVSAQTEKVSFLNLKVGSHLVAARLTEMGIKRGDKVAISAGNRPEYVATILATWRLGAIIVPLDVRLTTPEILNIAHRLAVNAFIGSSDHIEQIAKADQKLDLKNNCVVDIASFADCLKDDHIATEGDGNLASFDLKASSLMMLTSGTTGNPKAAVHDLESLVENALDIAEMVQLTPQKKIILPLPLSHIFGLEVMLVGMLIGAEVWFTSSTEHFFQALSKDHFDIVAAVPAMYGAMLAFPASFCKFQREDILLSGGAALPLSLANEFEKKFGHRLNNGYGSTESKIIALNLDGPETSVGKWVQNAEIKIVDENKEHLGECGIGEIVVKSKDLMQGYFQNPEETKKVLQDGYYHTGDLGFVKDGYLYISGRDKELINVAGNKVFPVEVEDVLRRHEDVKEVAVFGVPHYKLGQIVKAVVVLKEGPYSDAFAESPEFLKESNHKVQESLKALCKNSLKRELRPMEWQFRPASQPLPKTNNGKIDKKQLQSGT